jgi:hypothetical protein
MSGKAPNSTDPAKWGLHALSLLDPNDPDLTGPISRKQKYRTLAYHPQQQNGALQGPHAQLLDGWSEHALKHRLVKPDTSVEAWEQARWDASDERFLRGLPSCTAPEDVDGIMPEKWKPHRSDVDSDPRLARVTRLCTTVVNQVVDWVDRRFPERGPKTVAEWHKCEGLQAHIQEVLEMLTASLGEAVNVNALRDPAFIKRCWRSMSDEDHSSFEDSLERLVGMNNGGGGGNMSAAGSDDGASSVRSAAAAAAGDANNRRPQQQFSQSSRRF